MYQGSKSFISLKDLPKVRGRYLENASLAKYTWFRVGGNADVLFKPEDLEDLQNFLKYRNPDTAVTLLGMGSNVLVRSLRLTRRPGSGKAAGCDAKYRSDGKAGASSRGSRRWRLWFCDCESARRSWGHRLFGNLATGLWNFQDGARARQARRLTAAQERC